MSRLHLSLPVAAAVAFGLAAPTWAQERIESSAGPLEITLLAAGLTEPWGLAFLPEGTPIVTERGGRLLRQTGDGFAEITGAPQVYAKGQGGLLDVMVPRDAAQTREVWLAFAAPVGEGAATAVGRGYLSPDNSRLERFETLWTGDAVTGGHHFGARLVEDRDGVIWIATGDRGTGPQGMEAQDRALSLGKMIAIRRDGTPLEAPSSAARSWQAGVQTLGHRNIQGAALDASGALWVVEHGARGGDELNRITRGANYGWPVISYGVNYSGTRIGIGTRAEGMEQPQRYWDPSIAPSGLAVYDGALFEGWAGSILTGSLKFHQIHRLDPASGFAEEILKGEATRRVRDIRQGPDGALWFLSVGNGALYRMAPAGG